MTIDVRLIKDIQLAEGCRLTAYLDSLGKFTIGWGHLLAPNVVWAGHTITQAIADSLLEEDITKAATMAQHTKEWESLDTVCRENAVIELCFNLGTKWFSFRDTRLSLEAQEWEKAHDGLLNSLWAKQVGSTRSNRLANYIREGQYPN